IGSKARSDHATFVATHSSQVLRGILDTNRKVTVIRLRQSEGQFHAKLLQGDNIKKLQNPRRRAESVLDGIFSKAVILVESEGDREVYRAALESIPDYPSREVHIVPVGGTGGFLEPLQFFRSLDIPVAIIADLDLICDQSKLKPIIESAASDPEDLIQKVTKLSQRLMALHPLMTAEEAQRRLKELSESFGQWSGGEDNVLRRKLKELESELKRTVRLKNGGISSYSDNKDICDEMQDVVNQCQAMGVFFVPVGELEGWLEKQRSGIPFSGNKIERAASMAKLIRTTEGKTGDVWDFVKMVLDQLHMASLKA
ncbi:MAG: TOPRIM nucleotidyl transferase/hydrolase domain-containing protein, partial [Planctomycetaceae bacterium]